MAIPITIPRLGWSMEEGTFAGWLKQDGDFIRPGDMLFELEGEKALQEIEAVDSGFLRIPPDGPSSGNVLQVGAVVGYLTAELSETPWIQGSSPTPGSALHGLPGETQAAEQMPSPAEKREQLQLSAASEVVPNPTGTGAGSASRIIASPRAKRAAARLGVDLCSVAGTGRDGRIRERDVRAAAETFPQKVALVSQGCVVPLTGRRRVIAERLAHTARQVVPVTITLRADVENLVSLREQFKATGRTPVPAIHDIVAKLAASELLRVPQLAGRWDGDEIRLPEPGSMHIGIAVDTDEGLIVPVLRNVTETPLVALAAESSRLIGKAREGRLAPSGPGDSVFTISNLGHLGIEVFTPVINFPETAILGLGAIRLEPVAGADDRILVRRQMMLSLTFDHRVIDGAPAARFLQSLAKAISNPAAILLDMQ